MRRPGGGSDGRETLWEGEGERAATSSAGAAGLHGVFITGRRRRYPSFQSSEVVLAFSSSVFTVLLATYLFSSLLRLDPAQDISFGESRSLVDTCWLQQTHQKTFSSGNSPRLLAMAASLKRTEFYYNTENALQNVAVWEFPEELSKIPAEPAGKPKYWLV